MNSEHSTNEVREAPVFYPTLAEWNNYDPITYIEEVVRPVAERTGICKIVPPKDWKPPIEVEKTRSKFATRRQLTNFLEANARVRALFDEKVRKLCFIRGKPLERPRPGADPDWSLLFREVTKRGGYDIVNESLGWDHIHENVLSNPALATMTPAKLRDMYEECLLELERSVVLNNKNLSPATQLSMCKVSSPRNQRSGRSSEMSFSSSGPARNQMMSNGIMESPSKKTKIEGVLGDFRVEGIQELLADCESVPPSPAIGMEFWKWFPDKSKCYRGGVMSHSDKYGYRVVYKSVDEVFEVDEDEINLAYSIVCGATAKEAQDAFELGICQRCNRAHKSETILNCDGCDWRFHEACLSESHRSYGRKDLDWFCPVCLDRFARGVSAEMAPADEESSEVEELRALRQGISLSPITQVIGPDELAQFGFPDGDRFTRDEFIEQDQHFRTKYEQRVGKRVFHKEKSVESEFWKIARGEVYERIHVNYGNDLDTGAMGSGFPTLERLSRQKNRLDRMSPEQRQQLEGYATSLWNLTNFPTSGGSLLRHVDANISGIIVPWLYMGMTFSAFCFHVEDHNFASVNYHHQGAPKSWWGVPMASADRFEQAAKEMCPELFEARPDLLQAIVTLFDPKDMAKRGVAVYHLIQRPGEFVITFPRAYHGGFNHGFNTAEAVNFASRTWLPYGPQAVVRYAELRRTPVVAHEALLLAIAGWCLRESESVVDSNVVKTTFKLMAPFVEMVRREIQAREEVRMRLKKRRDVLFQPYHSSDGSHGDKRGLRRSGLDRRTVNVMGRVQNLSSVFDGVPRCSVCKRYCVLSHATEAGDSSRKVVVVCLEHTSEDATYFESYDLPGLEAVAQQLASRCEKAWSWSARAVRLVTGGRQPDAALGRDQAGGPELLFGVKASKSEFNSLLLNLPDQWTTRPPLTAVKKLLRLPGAELVDESLVLKQMVERAEALGCRCTRIRQTMKDGEAVPMEELLDLHDQLMKCELQLGSSLTSVVSDKLEAALQWKTAIVAQILPNPSIPLNVQLKSVESYLEDLKTRIEVDMPERVAAEDWLEWARWRVSAQKVYTAQDADAASKMLRDYRRFDRNLRDRNPEEVDLLQALVSCKIIWPERITNVLYSPISSSDIAMMVDSCKRECIEPPPELGLLEAKCADVEQWARKVTDFLKSPTTLDDALELTSKAAQLNIAKDDPVYSQLRAFEAPLRTVDSAFKSLGGYVKPKTCFCGVPLAGELVQCLLCEEKFHQVCTGSSGPSYICGPCEQLSATCYCRLGHEGMMAQCQVCSIWVHQECGKINVDDVEKTSYFECHQCCMKSNSKYLGANLDEHRHAETCATCKLYILKAGPKEGRLIRCIECAHAFHRVCALPGFHGKIRDFLCNACAVSRDEPRTALGNAHGFIARRNEFDARLQAMPKRPSASAVEQMIIACRLIPESFVPPEVQGWKDVYKEYEKSIVRMTSGKLETRRSYWEMLDEYLRCPLEPVASVAEFLYMELLYLELLGLSSNHYRSLNALEDLFASKRDEESFRFLCGQSRFMRDPQSGHILVLKQFLDDYRKYKSQNGLEYGLSNDLQERMNELRLSVVS